jgi:hypothetical protein
MLHLWKGYCLEKRFCTALRDDKFDRHDACVSANLTRNTRSLKGRIWMDRPSMLANSETQQCLTHNFRVHVKNLNKHTWWSFGKHVFEASTDFDSCEWCPLLWTVWPPSQLFHLLFMHGRVDGVFFSLYHMPVYTLLSERGSSLHRQISDKHFPPHSLEFDKPPPASRWFHPS